jgi:hypothetical protein
MNTTEIKSVAKAIVSFSEAFNKAADNSEDYSEFLNARFKRFGVDINSLSDSDYFELFALSTELVSTDDFYFPAIPAGLYEEIKNYKEAVIESSDSDIAKTFNRDNFR